MMQHDCQTTAIIETTNHITFHLLVTFHQGCTGLKVLKSSRNWMRMDIRRCIQLEGDGLMTVPLLSAC